jgi:hypothetical protein
MGLLSWLQRTKKWNADHRAAWAGMSDSHNGMLSRFQELARDALDAECKTRGLPSPAHELQLAGTNEPYLTGTLTNGRRYWIYSDGAGVEDQRLEEWDFRTPEELIAAFLADVPQTPDERAH